MNNIFHDGGTSATPVFVQLTGGTVFGDVDANHNLYWTTNSGLLLVQEYVAGRYSLGEYQFQLEHWSALQSRARFEVDSPEPQDPLFVDPETGDFHLQADSPAIGAGTATGADADRDGIPYRTPRSIGAYEYVE